MKFNFTYIISYDIKEDDVRDMFRELIKGKCGAEKLSESTYAFSSVHSVPAVKEVAMNLYVAACKENNKEINKEDKVWLICAEKKADPNTNKPYEMACYNLVTELLHNLYRNN